MMGAAGVTGVELAPTAVWTDPLRASPSEVHAVRDWWRDRGIRVVALQALLFGRPDLTLFESDAKRRATLDHLADMMDLAAQLGARPLVFGSPKNRLIGDRPPAEAWNIAREFFAVAGALAVERGVVLALEPNPAEYGCDFVRTAAEGLALVRDVASPGFQLHLDAGALTLNREPLPETITTAVPALCHFHASEPQLVPLGSGGADHVGCAAALRAAHYEGWVSVEMRSVPDGVAGLPPVLALLSEWYGV